jgi:hypothetical protein
MSSYPITGCGLSSKPRAAEPSMFEILSWAGNDDIPQSTVFEAKPQRNNHHLNTYPVETIKVETITQLSNVNLISN